MRLNSNSKVQIIKSETLKQQHLKNNRHLKTPLYTNVHTNWLHNALSFIKQYIIYIYIYSRYRLYRYCQIQTFSIYYSVVLWGCFYANTVQYNTHIHSVRLRERGLIQWGGFVYGVQFKSTFIVWLIKIKSNSKCLAFNRVQNKV